MEAAPPRVTPDRLMQLTGGYAPPLIVETALRLGVFDALDPGAKNIDQLLAATGASARGIGMLLNALVSLDLLIKTSDERFELTEESARFLVRGKPTFHGAFFLMTSALQLPRWARLTEIVITGRPAERINREDDGTRFFLGFVEDIFPIHLPGAQSLAEALNVAGAKGPMSVLDLAAGSGVWSIALAKQSQHVQVTAVDWSAVIPVTKRVTTREGVVDRYRLLKAICSTPISVAATRLRRPATSCTAKAKSEAEPCSNRRSSRWRREVRSRSPTSWLMRTAADPRWL